jgi:secreted trypsin-like serine protease
VNKFLSEEMNLKFVITAFFFLAISISPAHSIVNGSPAVGADYVVTMLTGNNARPYCTGAYLRPRVVVTAAHCVIKSGARTPELKFPLEDWYVSQPGIDVLTPESKSSKVKVLKIWTDPDYFNRWEPDNGLREGQVNDIAFLFLEKELSGPTITRAASRDEIESFRLGQGRAFHLGYGSIGDVNGQIWPNDGKPYIVEDIYGTNSQPAHIPIRDRILQVKYPYGKSVCPGDSGSPLLIKKGSEVIYLGTIFAGGNCEAAAKGIQNLPEASVTVLWPFVSALDEKYEEFLIEDSKPTAVVPTPTPKVSKLITIKCVKSKFTKKVSGKNPKCPTGYKKA